MRCDVITVTLSHSWQVEGDTKLSLCIQLRENGAVAVQLQWRYNSSYYSSQQVFYMAGIDEGEKEERKGGRNVATVKLLQKEENNRKNVR